MYQMLTDLDVQKYASMNSIIKAILRALALQAEGKLVSPPRFRVGAENGDLVFTAGAVTGLEKVIGFRVYDTYANDIDGHEQLVCVFDSETGVFKGIVIGNALGDIRTGAIGGVAIDALAREDARQIAVIGTGSQARVQLDGAVAVRRIERIRVFSRSRENRNRFSEEMTEKLGIEVKPFDSPKNCIEGSDIVICATNSKTPVFDAEWLKPGVHITTVGPKSRMGHELPFEAAARSSVIVTDSIEQLNAYTTPHFLVNSPYEASIVQLSDIVAGNIAGRTADKDITLFCSVGLAGTEVVVANEIMKLALEREETLLAMDCGQNRGSRQSGQIYKA
jgi:ornithine cyclodeaminase/alanine dehydrogenase-like protein (mu-crystallin family)